MVVNGKTIILTPGMGVQVEIKTGSRRVIQYLLTPLLQHKRESLSER
jgi:hemolysin D